MERQSLDTVEAAKCSLARGMLVTVARESLWLSRELTKQLPLAMSAEKWRCCVAAHESAQCWWCGVGRQAFITSQHRAILWFR